MSVVYSVGALYEVRGMRAFKGTDKVEYLSPDGANNHTTLNTLRYLQHRRDRLSVMHSLFTIQHSECRAIQSSSSAFVATFLILVL